MDDMESKFNAILGNPEMMQQIMAMAQSLGQPPPPPKGSSEPKGTQDPPKQPEASPLGNIDLSMIQKLSGLASQTTVDANQRFLLKALGPYLSQNRIQKLEKAMRAAKLAQFASAALNQNQVTNPPGR